MSRLVPNGQSATRNGRGSAKTSLNANRPLSSLIERLAFVPALRYVKVTERADRTMMLIRFVLALLTLFPISSVAPPERTKLSVVAGDTSRPVRITGPKNLTDLGKGKCSKCVRLQLFHTNCFASLQRLFARRINKLHRWRPIATECYKRSEYCGMNRRYASVRVMARTV